MRKIDRDQLKRLTRDELERLAWRAIEVALALDDKTNQNSTNSSRPPSSDDPYRRGEQREQAKAAKAETDATDPQAEKPAAKPSGKRPGQPGSWRKQPFVAAGAVDHDPPGCEACGAALGPPHRLRRDSAHCVYDLERLDMGLRIVATAHRYFAARCACGHVTVARPGTGACSTLEGRRRDLHLNERGLIGPAFATFIAALSLRCRLSRAKIQEFLHDWFGFELGVATIERCIHEFGLACEPVVDDLIADLRAAAVVHLDETPWYQKGALKWLWVASSASTVVFRIGTRAKEELTALIGEAYLGWLVSDGYGAYRDHPRRQRCLAHLIRKAVALAQNYYQAGSGFGRDLARDLRRLIERVAEGDNEAAVKRLVAAIKRTCQHNQYETEDKVRGLARELLNDWDAVMAFVADPALPPTNNDAERALRHAVIARRISFGTRTTEGSRCYAAALSVIDTCRKRALDVWAIATEILANARKGGPNLPIPLAQPP